MELTKSTSIMDLTKEEMMNWLMKCQQLQRMGMGILTIDVDMIYVKSIDLVSISLAVFKNNEKDKLEMIFKDTIFGHCKEDAPRVFNEFKNVIFSHL
jgi:hypothetical protein